MTTEKEIQMQILNHNAWTNGGLLETDSLGASGGMGEHLIFFNTQQQLTPLLKTGELLRAIRAVGTFDYKTNGQRKTPIKIFQDEYERLQNGGKIDYGFFHRLNKSMPERKDRFSIVLGKDFKIEAVLN